MKKNKDRVKLLEIEILGEKFKTLEFLRQTLPGRLCSKKIAYKTLYKYIDRGMPHFLWCNKILFSEQDLQAIPQWIAENCRRRKI